MKKIVTILLITIMFLTLTACGNDNSNNSSSGVNGSSQKENEKKEDNQNNNVIIDDEIIDFDDEDNYQYEDETVTVDEINNLGDITFIELPDVQTEFSKGEVFATIESVMAAKELYMPISGLILEVNEEVVENMFKDCL